MSMQALNGNRQQERRSSGLLQRYQPKTTSQDPLNVPITKSTSQRSLQSSSLLQKYYPRTNAPDTRLEQPPAESAFGPPKKSSSQRSLDQSKLLRKYYQQSSSQQSSQDGDTTIPQPDQPRYSSQKNLESSKLLQRYNPMNNSQEFTGLAVRESTPVARFTRSGSFDQERLQRSSLLSKYTPRFGKSLDRNRTLDVPGYEPYSSQRSLDTQEAPRSAGGSQIIADYGADHFDQYQDVRSRSSSMVRGGPRGRSAQRELDLARKLQMEMEPEAVTPETLPVVAAATTPVIGNIASALPMPMLGIVPTTPVVEDAPKPPVVVVAKKMEAKVEAPVVVPRPATPTPVPVPAQAPAKPVRKDLQTSPKSTVSMAIPSIITTLAVPSVKSPVKSEPQPPPPPPVSNVLSQPLYSSRDRLDHYGSASNPIQHQPIKPNKATPTMTATPTTLTKTTTLQLPISDFSSRRSMTDLHKLSGAAEPDGALNIEISEFADREELKKLSRKKEPVKHTLANAFEQIAAFSIPKAMEDEDERIEAIPPDRKLKRRDFTYHPTFVQKPATVEDSRRSTGSAGRQRDEEKRLRAEEEKRKRELEKQAKDEEKRRKGEERRAREEEEKRHKDEERRCREEEKRRVEDEKKRVEEEKRKEKEERKRLKEEKKKAAALQKAAPPVAPQPSEEPKVQPEEESIDLASHLDHYSVAMTQQRSVSLVRPKSGGTPYGSQGALGTQTKPLSRSQQSLDRSSSLGKSKLLQRYGPKAESQEVIGSVPSKAGQEFHRSQGSLDFRKPMRPSLLDKYTPRPLSASTAPVPAEQGVAIPGQQRSVSQRSLDSSTLLQRYKPRSTSEEGRNLKDNRRAAAFSQSIDHYDHRDHEYEPVGEPISADKTEKQTPATRLTIPGDGKERKTSDASFLRVPTDDGDTVSMEELQKSIEDRFFNQEPVEQHHEITDTVETSPTEAKPNKLKAAMAKAQSSGKQAMAKAQESSKNAMAKAQASGKSAMAMAQDGGKSLQKKLSKQTDKIKTKMSNIKIKKDKDAAPLASPEVVTTPELEKLDFTLAEPAEDVHEAELTSAASEQPVEDHPEDEATTASKGGKFSKLKNIHMPKIQKPDFKRPEFTKNLPKLKAPDMSKFKRPEMPKFLTEKPDFGKMKIPEKIKLKRSKSLKEPSPSDAASAASPSDTSALASDDGKGKVNYTDFSTYPRIFDKFKRQKTTNVSGQASVRPGTPPPLKFSKSANQPTEAHLFAQWTAKSSEDGENTQFTQYTGSELDDGETSIDQNIRQQLERAAFEGPELAITEEQKQLEEYDKENREIHILSAARHEEFLKRKPPMERQESDLASEEEKQFWASSLGQKIRQNIDMNSGDMDFLDEEDNLLLDRDGQRGRGFSLDVDEQQKEQQRDRRSSTPYTNQECQSSGSSSARRRKGVLEEIDDDEFFLRQKGISKDNIQMGEYISSAIKEGLSQPKNALAEMSRYDYYDEELDRDGPRYYQPSFESDDLSKQSFTDEFRRNADFYKTFPPDRPNRKQRKPNSFDDDDTQAEQKVPYGYEEEEDDLAFYDRNRLKYGSEQPELLQTASARYIDDDASLRNELRQVGSAVPPTPPTRRRKKRFREVTPSDVGSFANGFAGKSISNNFISGPDTTAVYRAEVPLAQEERFTPAPTPRRSRSRSQVFKTIDDDGLSRGAESLIGGIIDAPVVGSAPARYPFEISESTGYATVRKEAPPRPPAPIRRRKSTRSLDAPRQFNTLPNYHSVSPQRPHRNYSTINPNRPPRRKSITSLGDHRIISKDDITQYEEIEEVDSAPVPPPPPPKTLQSGDVVNRMKDRPLPPPPRPTRKPRKPDGSDRHDFDGGAERIVAPVAVQEVEIAIQTDPVSDDFSLDAEIAAVTDRVVSASSQHSQSQSGLSDAENLERSLQRFREANQKAMADRPKSSRPGSRSETPSILIERKVSTPDHLKHESVVEASLTVQPLNNDDVENWEDDNYIAELVKKYVSDERKPPEARKTEERRFRKSSSSLNREEELRHSEGSHTLRTPSVRSGRSSVDGRGSAATPEPLRNVEISPTVIEEIVERLRTNEQQHFAELQQLHLQQLEDLRSKHDEQKQQQEQKMEEQQRVLLEQQSQQLAQTQQLKEQIVQQQEHQKMLLQQQQQQQQQLLLAQQQQQLLLEQQEKERELQREKERELLKEREQELERARERERELHHARELELQRSRELEQQRARELEQQRLRELEQQRVREIEQQHMRELELQRARELEMQRIRELEMQRAAAEAEAARLRDVELLQQQRAATKVEEGSVAPADADTADPQPAVDVVDHGTANVSAAVATGAIPKDTREPVTLPVRPPLPLPTYMYPEYLPYSGAVPAAQYLMRDPAEEDGSAPLAPLRRRRHHRSRRESTSEEDFQREQRRPRHATRSPEPSIGALSGQLARVCSTSLMQFGDDLISVLRATGKDETKRDLHVAIMILIVIVAALMALGMSGEKAVHHHHWDYFNPPSGNSGTV